MKNEELEYTSAQYYCTYCGRKMLYLKEDSLMGVFCNCKEWNKNYKK